MEGIGGIAARTEHIARSKRQIGLMVAHIVPHLAHAALTAVVIEQSRHVGKFAAGGGAAEGAVIHILHDNTGIQHSIQGRGQLGRHPNRGEGFGCDVNEVFAAEHAGIAVLRGRRQRGKVCMHCRHVLIGSGCNERVEVDIQHIIAGRDRIGIGLRIGVGIGGHVVGDRRLSGVACRRLGHGMPHKHRIGRHIGIRSAVILGLRMTEKIVAQIGEGGIGQAEALNAVRHGEALAVIIGISEFRAVQAEAEQRADEQTQRAQTAKAPLTQIGHAPRRNPAAEHAVQHQRRQNQQNGIP